MSLFLSVSLFFVDVSRLSVALCVTLCVAEGVALCYSLLQFIATCDIDY